jgi:hypothetical protein
MQGICYLHSHSIAHRVRRAAGCLGVVLTAPQDLSYRNILVNYFGDSTWPSQDDHLRDVFIAQRPSSLRDLRLQSVCHISRRYPFSCSTSALREVVLRIGDASSVRHRAGRVRLRSIRMGCRLPGHHATQSIPGLPWVLMHEGD